ncbi:YfbM family protein [Nocardia sp. NPDC058176]|uniref:YfbM family protein n=1 Tax=Nocardia sp. NPDC058176 TaxID=3346368 RepID=UPI0036DB1553
MGVTMSFTRVSAADLELVMRHTDCAQEFLAEFEPPESDPSGYLDKSWAGLKYLLEAADTGIDLFFTGTPLPIGEYSGWTPDDVSHTAELLSGTPFDVLAAHYDPHGMDRAGVYPRIWLNESNGGLDYLDQGYAALVEVFEYAARHRSGLLQHFA